MINGVQFAGAQLQGETAKWSGDYTTKKRVFGVIRPETGIDWHFFASTAKKEGLKIATGAEVVYTRADRHQPDLGEEPGGGADPRRQAQGRGVTTVMLFTSFAMNQAVLKAADSLDYHPEWFFPGLGAQDIEITARIQATPRADGPHLRDRRPAALRRRASTTRR